MPQWEAVGDDLNAPRVRDRDLDVHVGDPEIAGDTGSGLTAHPRDGPSECSARVASTPKVAHALPKRPGARGCKHQGPAGAGVASVGAGAPEIAHWDDDAIIGGRDSEGSRGVRPGLQRARRRCQVSKIRLARALITGPGGTALPQMIARLIPDATGRGVGKGNSNVPRDLGLGLATYI